MITVLPVAAVMSDAMARAAAGEFDA